MPNDKQVGEMMNFVSKAMAANAHALEVVVASFVEFAGPDGEELRALIIERLRAKFPRNDPLGRLLHDVATVIETGADQSTRPEKH